MLPVCARQSWVYNAFTFCSSESTAAVLAARDTKMACWVCKVEDITEGTREFSGKTKDGTIEHTLGGSLTLYSRG
jgi:hypothetical protein